MKYDEYLETLEKRQTESEEIWRKLEDLKIRHKQKELIISDLDANHM